MASEREAPQKAQKTTRKRHSEEFAHEALAERIGVNDSVQALSLRRFQFYGWS